MEELRDGIGDAISDLKSAVLCCRQELTRLANRRDLLFSQVIAAILMATSLEGRKGVLHDDILARDFADKCWQLTDNLLARDPLETVNQLKQGE
jgi:hypothetical protein